MPPYGACLLGSINLARLVRHPVRAQCAARPGGAGGLIAHVAVRMLDNVIDVSRFPLAQQRQEAMAKRRIGLGVTGLADALIFCGARYGSEDGVGLTEDWLAALSHAAYRASAALAAEKGAFPLFDADEYPGRPRSSRASMRTFRRPSPPMASATRC